MFTKIFARPSRAGTRCALAAVLTLATVGTVEAGTRCAERRAERKAYRTAAPAVRVAPVRAAVVAPVARVFQFATGRGPVCSGAGCSK